MANRRGRGGADAPAPDVGKLFDKVPPHASVSERAVLGSMLLEPGLVPMARGKLSPNMFFTDRHSLVFESLCRVYDRDQTTDIAMVFEDMKVLWQERDGDLAAYLMELAEAVPSTAHCQYHAAIVHDAHCLRVVANECGQMLHDVYHARLGEQTVALDVASKMVAKGSEIASELVDEPELSLADQMQADVDRAMQEELGGQHQTHLPDLDRMIGGFDPGQVVVIAARPSMGKTAMALQLAMNMAAGCNAVVTRQWRDGLKVRVYSIEMNRDECARRMLSAVSGVNNEVFRQRACNPNEGESIKAAAALFRREGLCLDVTGKIERIEAIHADVVRAKAQHGCDVVVVDYLQMVQTSRRSDSREQEVSSISRRLKSMAKECGVTVIVAAQLNRGAEQRPRPRMSDLRESGSIEQDADLIMLLHREDYYHRGDPAWDVRSVEFNEDNRSKIGVAELIVDKNRNGAVGVCRFRWEPESTRFTSISEREDDYGGYADNFQDRHGGQGFFGSKEDDIEGIPGVD